MSQTPNITDCFTWKGRQYRATAYTRTVQVELSPLVSRLLGKTHADRVVFCGRDEATHVVGCGVAGCQAPVGEITDVEPISGWTQAMIDQEVSTAELLVGHEAG